MVDVADGETINTEQVQCQWCDEFTGLLELIHILGTDCDRLEDYTEYGPIELQLRILRTLEYNLSYAQTKKRAKKEWITVTQSVSTSKPSTVWSTHSPDRSTTRVSTSATPSSSSTVSPSKK